MSSLAHNLMRAVQFGRLRI